MLFAIHTQFHVHACYHMNTKESYRRHAPSRIHRLEEDGEDLEGLAVDAHQYERSNRNDELDTARGEHRQKDENENLRSK